jgi:hypothetical protein
MEQNLEVGTAYLRLGTLVDRIFQVVPNTAIVVSTLLPNAHAQVEANSQIYNKDLVGMVAERAGAGKAIALVNMSSDWFSTADLQSDGIHPTDTGYMKMAKVFYNGIIGLSDRINPPVSVAGVNDLTAKNDPGAGTALDAICKTTPGQAVPSAQRVECGLTGAPVTTTSTVRTPSAGASTTASASARASTTKSASATSRTASSSSLIHSITASSVSTSLTSVPRPWIG